MLQHIISKNDLAYLHIYCFYVVLSSCLFVTFKFFFNQSRLNYSTLEPNFDKINEISDQSKQTNLDLALKNRLPDLICIGVKKCGTGALVSFLQNHSKVKISYLNADRKEPHFYDRNYENGVDWYLKQFPNVSDVEILMEKTPKYLSTYWLS